jgi:NAD(P)-dependent dehydrogenase (short-subunit alcohol dehydrogenase family)
MSDSLAEKSPCFPDLRGQVALVTGGGTGIGRGIAVRLAAEGMKVAVCGRRAEKLEGTSRQIAADGGEVLAVPADVANPDALHDLCDRVESEWGRVDALVHNAMQMNFKGLDDCTLEVWRNAFATGSQAAYLLAQRLVPGLRERGRGGIVLISSVLAQRPNRNGAAYCAVKGALESMTRQMAMALAGDGIRVNALAPGLVSRRPDPTRESLSCDLIPLGRAGTPAEMAAVVAFLLSDHSSYITGQVIHADGGTSVQLVPPGMRL